MTSGYHFDDPRVVFLGPLRMTLGDFCDAGGRRGPFVSRLFPLCFPLFSAWGPPGGHGGGVFYDLCCLAADFLMSSGYRFDDPRVSFFRYRRTALCDSVSFPPLTTQT